MSKEETLEQVIERGVKNATDMGSCMTQDLGVDVPKNDENVNILLKDACMGKFVTSKMRNGGKYRRRRKSRRSRKSKRKSRRKKRRKSKKRKTRRRRRRRK